MAKLMSWVAIEREHLEAEIKWFKAGAKLISPSGDDISARKLAELEKRVDELNRAAIG